jgi:hypothetical protein
MTRPLLSSLSVAPTSEPITSSALVEPSSAVDARIRQLAHAALVARHAAPRIALWELTLNAALIASYAAYAASQVFRIVAGNHG